MSAISPIEWTDRTWNPVRGCSVVSPGCVNCYAMKLAHRFSGAGKPYDGLTKQTKAGPQWTGKVVTVEDALMEPLSWRKPQRVFVNSMSDLFHEDVPVEFIGRVFNVMGQADRHTFQILTKRPERMRAVMRAYYECVNASQGVYPNVWLGVSVEDQQRADERIPLLLKTPAAVRFLSAEPLLGTLELDHFLGFHRRAPWIGARVPPIDWVIVGGESGSGARPMQIEWARSIIQQCKDADVACFVKQLGSNVASTEVASKDLAPFITRAKPILDRKGGNPEEWPSDLRVREFPA